MDVIRGYRELGKYLIVVSSLVATLALSAEETIGWAAHDQFLGTAQLAEGIDLHAVLAAETFFLVDHARLYLFFDAKQAKNLLDLELLDFSAQMLGSSYFVSDAFKIERQNIGKAVISGIRFPKPGEWLLRFDLKLGNEKKLVTIKVKI